MPKLIVSTVTVVVIALVFTAAAQDSPAQESEIRENVARTLVPDADGAKRSNVAVTGHVIEPEQIKASPDEVIEKLTAPDGFKINAFAQELVHPRMIAVADNGTVYVSRPRVGDLIMLRDTDGDGEADVQRSVASRPDLHGIAIDGDTLYLVTVKDVYRAARNADGTLGELERIIDDLPDGGQHPNRTAVVGPEGKLFISIGSTCNACSETNPEHATIVRADSNGAYRQVYASGLRNTIGFAFHPQTRDLWGMDQGIDWLGDEEQPEELNRIVEGAHYGWPYVYGDGGFNPQDDPPGNLTIEEWAAQSVPPVGLYTAHASPMQLIFYTGDSFPDEYLGDAFIAMRGSWNRKPPAGYEILRIRFDENGQPQNFEPFVSGFLQELKPDAWGHYGRLAGMAQMPDGSLLVSDDTNGVIYRISYATTEGDDRTAATVRAPRNDKSIVIEPKPAETPAAKPQTIEQLALKAVAADADSLSVTSEAFTTGETIPETYSADGQNISPPLTWGAAPAETRSFVVMMEDPGFGDPPPFVHWTAYNIPADTHALREGIPPTPSPPVPEGILQGQNGAGTIGYFGMKPPRGAGEHEYHFQVFALDMELELPHGVQRPQLLAAMKGHVLAAGEVVGTFSRPKE